MKTSMFTGWIGYATTDGKLGEIWLDKGKEFEDDHPAVASRPELFEDGPGGTQAANERENALRAEIEELRAKLASQAEPVNTGQPITGTTLRGAAKSGGSK